MAQPYQHIDIAPEASDFLELLRELGHLDDRAVDTITAALMTGAAGGAVVGVADVRRACAIWLTDHGAHLRPEAQELLQMEWPRLFF
jgi:hypothetical protein